MKWRAFRDETPEDIVILAFVPHDDAGNIVTPDSPSTNDYVWAEDHCHILFARSIAQGLGHAVMLERDGRTLSASEHADYQRAGFWVPLHDVFLSGAFVREPPPKLDFTNYTELERVQQNGAYLYVTKSEAD